MNPPRFLERKECLVPTPWAWSIALLVCAFGLLVFVLFIHGFLAPVHPVKAGILIVEGWMPEYALEQAVGDFKSGKYAVVVVAGGPVESGHFLTRYKSLANVGAATLRKLGIDSSRIAVVPSQFVQKDRTYEEAVSVRRWLAQNPNLGKSLNLYSIGCHSRRSQLLYSRVLGKAYTVGIVACACRDYDSRRWWHYSNGVRAVADETLAFCYAFLFTLFASTTD